MHTEPDGSQWHPDTWSRIQAFVAADPDKPRRRELPSHMVRIVETKAREGSGVAKRLLEQIREKQRL